VDKKAIRFNNGQRKKSNNFNNKFLNSKSAKLKTNTKIKKKTKQTKNKEKRKYTKNNNF